MQINILRNSLIALGVVLSISVILGCKKDTPHPPGIAIQSISPGGDVPLVAGEKVRFSVKLLVRNSPNGSKTGLSIQSGGGVSLVGFDPILVKNDELMELDATIVVPNETSLEIHAPLFLPNQSHSKIFDARQYKIIGNSVK